LARCKNKVTLPTNTACVSATPLFDCFLIKIFVGVIESSVPPPDATNSPPVVPIIKLLEEDKKLIALTWLDAIV
jgi:hypothetical protein